MAVELADGVYVLGIWHCKLSDDWPLAEDELWAELLVTLLATNEAHDEWDVTLRYRYVRDPSPNVHDKDRKTTWVGKFKCKEEEVENTIEDCLSSMSGVEEIEHIPVRSSNLDQVMDTLMMYPTKNMKLHIRKVEPGEEC